MEDHCEYTVGRTDLYAGVPGSTLGRDASYPNRAFSWLFLNSETKFISYLKIACYILVVFDIDSVVE